MGGGGVELMWQKMNEEKIYLSTDEEFVLVEGGEEFDGSLTLILNRLLNLGLVLVYDVLQDDRLKRLLLSRL